jgi:glucokinase
VLEDVVELACSLLDESKTIDAVPTAIGIGVCELVSPCGEVLSDATIAWKGLPIARIVRERTHLKVCLDADVRVAARAEANLGAGCGCSSFLYVTVGTGISASLVVEGEPYCGARGLTGTFASGGTAAPARDGRLVHGLPLEQFAAGPAIAARFEALEPAFHGAAPDVLALAEGGNSHARAVVETAAQALGAAVAQLVNMLDPKAVVLGGGLGLATGLYRSALEAALHQHVWAEEHRGVPVISARLGTDAGLIGAALRAAGLQD